MNAVKEWIFFIVIMTLWLCGGSEAKAVEIWSGGNFTHISHFDAGPPFNNNAESSVDHLGVYLEVRTMLNNTEFVTGISAGKNSNLFGASYEWEDGGAAVGTVLYFKFGWKIGEL